MYGLYMTQVCSKTHFLALQNEASKKVYRMTDKECKTSDFTRLHFVDYSDSFDTKGPALFIDSFRRPHFVEPLLLFRPKDYLKTQHPNF